MYVQSFGHKFFLKSLINAKFTELETRLQELSNDILYAKFRQLNEK